MYEREDRIAIEESEDMTIGEPRSQMMMMVTKMLMIMMSNKDKSRTDGDVTFKQQMPTMLISVACGWAGAVMSFCKP